MTGDMILDSRTTWTKVDDNKLSQNIKEENGSVLDQRWEPRAQ